MKTIKRLRKYNKLKTEIPNSCKRCLIRSNMEWLYEKLLNTETIAMGKSSKSLMMFGLELMLMFRCPCCAENLMEKKEKDEVNVFRETIRDSKIKPYKLTPFDNLIDESTDKESINLAYITLNQPRGVAPDFAIIDEVGFTMDFSELEDNTEVIHIDTTKSNIENNTTEAFPENNNFNPIREEVNGTLPKVEIELPEYLKGKVDNNIIKGD